VKTLWVALGLSLIGHAVTLYYLHRALVVATRTMYLLSGGCQ